MTLLDLLFQSARQGQAILHVLNREITSELAEYNQLTDSGLSLPRQSSDLPLGYRRRSFISPVVGKDLFFVRRKLLKKPGCHREVNFIFVDSSHPVRRHQFTVLEKQAL